VFDLSLRDVELNLAERGIVVTHEGIRLWCLKFGTDFARRLHRRRRIGEMARLPSASSSASCIGYDTSRGGSSQTACAAMVLLNELSCPMCVIGQADT
jgi:hypothetical protein